jgi:hypothetical protein
MTKNRNQVELLTELRRKRDEVEAVVDEMIADMAEAPPEQRSTGDWAQDGASTRRYLELSNRQAELEDEIADLSRAITETAKPTLPN